MGKCAAPNCVKLSFCKLFTFNFAIEAYLALVFKLLANSTSLELQAKVISGTQHCTTHTHYFYIRHSGVVSDIEQGLQRLQLCNYFCIKAH